MYHFCTYFDHHYLTRGLALLASLRRHCPSFRLYILCLSDSCYQTLAALTLPEVALIPLADFEQGDQALLAAKSNRSRSEYYFTCTPSLPLYLFRRYPEVELLTYLDSDLFFFQDPAPLFAEINGHSIAIIGHRFPPALRHLERWGKYNVGWVSCRRDEDGLACLRWYRQRCLEWCYDYLDGDRFADQKYLDTMASDFPGVMVLQHRGANLGPWNIDNFRLSGVNGQVRVDSDPLIFFHFQGFKQIYGNFYDVGFWPYRSRLTPLIRRQIFCPYIRELRGLESLAPPATGVDVRHNRPSSTSGLAGWWQTGKRLAKIMVRRSWIYYQE